MTETEAVEIYNAEVKRLAKLFCWQSSTQVRSRREVHHSVAHSLMKYYGRDPDDLAEVLVYGSDKASERGMNYVIRTVNAAWLSRPN